MEFDLETQIITNFKSLLISEVQKCPCIWNKCSNDYKNLQKTRRDWDYISARLGAPVEDCKKTWKNLVDTFRANCKKAGLGGCWDEIQDIEEKINKVRWVYFKQMQFVKDALYSRESSCMLEDSEMTVDVESQIMDIGDYFENELIVHSQEIFNQQENAVEQTLNRIEEVLKKHESREKTFANYLCNAIKKVPEERRLKCELEVMNVVLRFSKQSETK